MSTIKPLQGFGPKRIAAVRHSLADILSRSTPPHRQADNLTGQDRPQPEVALLLEVDAEYRRRAQADELPKLAPRHYNPKNEAWLPVMRTEQDGWTMTVLFSNTTQAHELGKTYDWVVIYYQKEGAEYQSTVVTEIRGSLKGQRVIRGREKECIQFYRARQDRTKR
jgi:hypothetical protein